jgi:hypothetical protein
MGKIRWHSSSVIPSNQQRRLVRMEVHDVLVRALKAVDEADIPEELRTVAFGKAVDLIAADAGGTTERSQQRRDLGGSGHPATGDLALDKIAARLKLDVGVVQDVFHYDDERGLQIVVSSKKLEASRSGGTKQLALLVAAGRQAAGLDEGDWTDVGVIRQVCQDYKKFDSSNFAKHIAGMKYEFNVTGSAQKRLVKITRPGWDAARELVERLAGAEG